MFRRRLAVMCLLCLFTFGGALQQVKAKSSPEVSHEKILIVDASDRSRGKDNVRLLERLLNHFSTDVTIVSDNVLNESHIEQSTYLFYYSDEQKDVSADVRSLINHYDGTFIGIGENVDAFNKLPSVENLRDREVNEMSLGESERHKQQLDHVTSIKTAKQSDDMTVHINGYIEDKRYPVFFEEAGDFYLGISELFGAQMYYVAERLHDVIANDHADERTAYIELTDIHPETDAERLEEVGTYLLDENIPFTMAVTPVHVDIETGKRTYFKKDSPILDVLTDLQAAGGVITAHGYTKVDEDDLFSESAEFWDIRRDEAKIPQAEDDFTHEKKESFANESAREAYVERMDRLEADYAADRLRQSVHEFIIFDLYPLAFHVPHDKMSAAAYERTAKTFPLLFGKLQLSDEQANEAVALPFIINAYDFTVIPETLGYLPAHATDPLSNKSEKIEQLLIVRDSVLGASFHVYLGVDAIKPLVEKLRHVPNVSWLDVRTLEQTIRTEDVQITSKASGEITVDSHLSRLDHLLRHTTFTLTEKILWGVASIVLLTICLFLLSTLYLRTQLKKRLFKERKHNG